MSNVCADDSHKYQVLFTLKNTKQKKQIRMSPAAVVIGALTHFSLRPKE